ncbi:MAG: MATE family efflux transporter [Bacteroidaceae bacterium]|nr:MATE family efflux transporter [Bacteroidaceae bacterium]
MDNRDSIDFATTKVSRLFRRMFIPTLIGMVSIVILNITDGAFVGHGCGSDALAAVNIVAPLFLISSGIGLMFGIGGSVVASIHLSRGKAKAANINVTQALIGALLTGLVLSIALLSFQREVCMAFGSSEALVGLACGYMKWIALFMPMSIVNMVIMFIIRLDGSPRYAMWVHLLSASLNILFDYLFIFPFGWGLEGAAMATSFSFAIGGLLGIFYIFFRMERLSLYRLKMSKKSFMLSVRNLGYQTKLGFSAMLGEVAIAAVIVVGNYVFIEWLGEDGVAAYSVACYCLPIVFMLGNAVVQSVQPILSFGHGGGSPERVREACRIAFGTAVASGLGCTIVLALGSDMISAVFLDVSCRAYELCREGLPYFAAGFLFVAVNIVAVGYYQSIERSVRATVYTLLRGFIFVFPCFCVVPSLLGVPGLWLALPIAEGLTLAVIVVTALVERK